jgi:undecaprenyl-diphosphatase
MATPRAERRPAAAHAASLRDRRERGAFAGLPLTLLGAAFVLLLLVFGGLTWGVLASGPLVALDARLAALLAAHREPAPTRAFLWFTFLGRGEVAAAAALAACVLFLLWRRRHLVAPLLVALAGTGATVRAVKGLVLRARPGAELAHYVEASFAFPSGHSATAVALYGFLAYALARDAATRTRRAGVILVALAVILMVGLSRLYLGVHFLSDVLGGYLLGLLWLVAGASLAELLRARSPIAAAPPRPPPPARAALATASVAAALLFYMVFALRHAPPPAAVGVGTSGAAANSPAVRERLRVLRSPAENGRLWPRGGGGVQDGRSRPGRLDPR